MTASRDHAAHLDRRSRYPGLGLPGRCGAGIPTLSHSSLKDLIDGGSDDSIIISQGPQARHRLSHAHLYRTRPCFRRSPQPLDFVTNYNSHSMMTMRRYVLAHRNGIDGLELEQNVPAPELKTPTDVSQAQLA
jgi:hypothetical protein